MTRSRLNALENRKVQLLLSWALRAGAFGILGLLARRYIEARGRPEGHPWIILQASLNALALFALSFRWAEPKLKRTAMTIALLSALAAFICAQQLSR